MKRTLCILLLVWASCVYAQARDKKAPTVTITAPTSASTYSTTATQLTLAGTAKDPGGAVARVTWRTDKGTQGIAQGTTSWSFPVTLAVGTTQVTVTAVDAVGNAGQDMLTVTVMSQPPPPGPITVDWSYSGSGDAFQMERCTESQPGCPMASVAAIAIGDRTWTDSAVSPSENYCYRMAVTTGGTLGAYSNTMCSP